MHKKKLFGLTIQPERLSEIRHERKPDSRYASLPNIMKAKAKPLALKTPADYGVDVSPRLTVLKTVEPAGRKAGVKVGSVAELIAKLKDEAGVI